MTAMVTGRMDSTLLMLLHEKEEQHLPSLIKCAVLVKAAHLKPRMREVVEERVAKLENVVRVRALRSLVVPTSSTPIKSHRAPDPSVIFSSMLVEVARALLLDIDAEWVGKGPCLSETYGGPLTTALLRERAAGGFEDVTVNALLDDECPYLHLFRATFRDLAHKLSIMLDCDEELAPLIDRDLEAEQREQEMRAAGAFSVVVDVDLSPCSSPNKAHKQRTDSDRQSDTTEESDATDEETNGSSVFSCELQQQHLSFSRNSSGSSQVRPRSLPLVGDALAGGASVRRRRPVLLRSASDDSAGQAPSPEQAAAAVAVAVAGSEAAAEPGIESGGDGSGAFFGGGGGGDAYVAPVS